MEKRLLMTVALLALLVCGAVAASAVASPEFVAEKYPVTVEGASTNIHGFEGAGFAWACTEASVRTGEEGIADPIGPLPTLTVHPKYEKCWLTLIGPVTGESRAVTEGCQYVFTAAPGPNKLEAEVEVKCGKQAASPTAGNCKVTTKAGEPCEIRLEAVFLPGCVVSFGAQKLKTVEYKNEPAGEVKIGAELKGIKTKIAESCGIGKVQATSEYREGEFFGGKNEKNARLAPVGKHALFQIKGKSGTEADPIEVVINEPHWYENHTALGTGEEAGEQALMWGKLVLTDAGAGIGTAECQTEWGGKVYNPAGAGGSAGPGEAKIDAFQAYNCTSTVCETTDASKLTVTPEGLGVSGLSTLAWEAKLSAGPTRLKLGNKTPGSPTQIKWHVVCPKTTGAEYDKKWKGELAPELENGTAIGSAPSKLTFNLGELEVEAVTEGKVSNKLKLMGYEGGEIISTKAP